MRPELSSLTLDVDGSKIAAIRQCDPTFADPPRLLCLHGWLDNANSFVPLMPYLPAFDLVAIDLPGHGFSDAIEAGYTFPELSYRLARILQALNWPDCHLLGHSLGGCLAPVFSVASSQVSRLVLIEASGPLSEPAEALPARLASSLDDRMNADSKVPRLFSDKQQAVDSRLRAAKMHTASARLIIDRQLVKTTDGYRWRFDPRWRHASAQYQTEEQVLAVLSAVVVPTLSIIADEGYLQGRDSTESRLACLRDHQSVTLPGHHHLHMDTPEPVAMAINRFLDATPDLGG